MAETYKWVEINGPNGTFSIALAGSTPDGLFWTGYRNGNVEAFPLIEMVAQKDPFKVIKYKISNVTRWPRTASFIWSLGDASARFNQDMEFFLKTRSSIFPDKPIDPREIPERVELCWERPAGGNI